MSPDRDRRGDPQAGCCARHRRPGFHRRAILDAVNNGKTDDAVISLEWTSAALFTRPTRHQPPEIAVLPRCRRTGLGTTRRDRHPARRARPTRRGSHQRRRHAVRPAGLLAAAHHQVPVTFVIASNEQYGVLAGFSRMLNVPEVSRHTAPDRRDTSKPQVKGTTTFWRATGHHTLIPVIVCVIPALFLPTARRCPPRTTQPRSPTTGFVTISAVTSSCSGGLLQYPYGVRRGRHSGDLGGDRTCGAGDPVVGE
jgi:hypothetical protein